MIKIKRTIYKHSEFANNMTWSFSIDRAEQAPVASISFSSTHRSVDKLMSKASLVELHGVITECLSEWRD